MNPLRPDDLAGGRFNGLVLLLLAILLWPVSVVRPRGWRALPPTALRPSPALEEAEPAEPETEPAETETEPGWRGGAAGRIPGQSGVLCTVTVRRRDARVLSWARFPCSLRFAGAAPSEAMVAARAGGALGAARGHSGASRATTA